MGLLTGLLDELLLRGVAIPVVGMPYCVHIDVWNLNASLAFEDREWGGTYHAFADELPQFGLEHEDLKRAVEAQGAINISGQYAISFEIAEKMNAIPDIEQRARRFVEKAKREQRI